MAAHTTPFAGTWYPAEAGELERLLDEVFERSRQRIGLCSLPAAVAYVVPHAGLAYSGTVAAAAYRHLSQRKPDRIILLGFSHRGGPPGVAVPDVARIATPLGDVEIDGAALAASGVTPAVPHRARSECLRSFGGDSAPAAAQSRARRARHTLIRGRHDRG